MKLKCALLLCLITPGPSGTGFLIAQEPPTVLSINTGSLRCDVNFSGPAGSVPLMESSTDLRKWIVKGAATESAPGSFQWSDSSPIQAQRNFYQVLNEVPAASASWLTGWSGGLPAVIELPLPPEFSWLPFPAGGPVTYHFEFCEATDNGDGGLTPVFPVLANGEGLTSTAFNWPEGGTWPAPGGRYLWRVTAVDGNQCWEGRWAAAPGIALTENRVRGRALAAVNGPRGGVVPVDWNKIIKVMNEITEKKNEIKKQLEENDLIRQLDLLKKLKEILTGLDATKDALDSWLNAPSPTLPSADQVLKTLCFLDSAGELMQKLDKKMSPRLKAALKNLTDRVHEYKTQLKLLIENHGDTAGFIQLIMNQLRALLQQSRFDGSGLWEYIVGWVKEKALEKLKEVLEEELGKKAAGALLSILQDIYSFLDAIENLDDLKALCIAYNKTVLQAIANSTWPLPADWEYFGTVKERDLGCDFILRPYKRCFRQTGTDPNDGDWEKTPVRFTDGSSSKQGNFRTAVSENNHDGTYGFSFPFDLNEADLACPPGAGPCLLLAEVCIICPGADSSRDGCYHFFIQPLKCP